MYSFFISHESKNFTFSDNLGLKSKSFENQEDCIISLLYHCLKENKLIITLYGIPLHVITKINESFGKSFSLKFKFAHLSQKELINFSLSKTSLNISFFEKLTFFMLSMHKVDCEHKDIIRLHLPDSTNPKVQQFFSSKNFIASDSCQLNFNPGDISFFSDASCDYKTMLAGAAMQNNQLICAFRHLIPLEDNNLAELKAIYHTLLLAISMNLSKFIIYTDNSNAIDFLSGKSKINKSNQHFFDVSNLIKENLNYFDSFYIGWIPRKKNMIADNLSKYNFNGHFYSR